MKNIAYASSEWSGEAAHLHSLARAFADSAEMNAWSKLFISSCDLGTYRICEQQNIRPAFTFAQSRQRLRWLH